MKTPPPLLGFNNNVRHHGRIFHIQTEDSGVKRPHIITHLFGDGGRILKTLRTDYAEHVDNDDMPQVVRRMMKEQHKAMFVALRAGELDDIIVQAFGPPQKRDSEKPERAPRSDTLRSFEARPERPVTPEEFAARAAPLPTPMPEEWQRALDAAEAERNGGFPEREKPSAPRLPTPPPVSHSIGGAVEAMAAKAAGLPFSEAPDEADGETPLSVPPDLHLRRPAPDTPGRYSISKPASIFSERAQPDARSIFGDSLIGEKSLDEVILSYLAEDLENPK